MNGTQTAMKSAPALLKIARHRIDALQKALSAADGDKMRLLTGVEALERTRSAEAAAADPTVSGRVDPVELQSLAAFLRASRDKQKTLEAQVSEVGERVDVLRRALVSAFADEKKVELLANEAKARRERALAAAETAAFDEMAIQRMAMRS